MEDTANPTSPAETETADQLRQMNVPAAPDSPAKVQEGERGPGPELNDFPPPSENPPPQIAPEPDPWGREGTAKQYPPGASDTPDGPMTPREIRAFREQGGELEPKPFPSEVNANPGQNRPPESALYPDAAQRRSDQMQGIPDLPPADTQTGYIHTPKETDVWVPPSDRPVPGDWAQQRTLADVPATLRALAGHIREKKAAASAAPFSLEEETNVLEALADFVEGETSDGKGQVG